MHGNSCRSTLSVCLLRRRKTFALRREVHHRRRERLLFSYIWKSQWQALTRNGGYRTSRNVHVTRDALFLEDWHHVCGRASTGLSERESSVRQRILFLDTKCGKSCHSSAEVGRHTPVVSNAVLNTQASCRYHQQKMAPACCQASFRPSPGSKMGSREMQTGL